MENKIALTRPQLAEKHSFVKEFIFSLKTKYLTFKRKMNNGSMKIFPEYDSWDRLEVLGQSTSELWNSSDNKENWIMTAGKIQNLRIAASKINGITVPAGEIFSFWKYIGNPSKANGFVVGREIREGCIVPSTAGGLCQLSNALYDAALKAGFIINERHRHSQVLKGSLAEQDRDATIKWNYIDLRFSSTDDFKISIEMNNKALTVKFKGKKKAPDFANLTYVHKIAPSPLNDCLSCRNMACYICDTNTKNFNEGAITYILDEKWVEYEDFINKRIRKQDIVLQAFSPFWSSALKRKDEQWDIKKGKRLYYSKSAFKRLKDFHQNKPKNVFSWQLKVDEELVKKLITKIPVESTHIVASQNLIPFLSKYFALAGRSYEILMMRSAVEKIQSCLDVVYKKYPNSPTLCDFRASKEFIELENNALKNADTLITTHLQISESFSNTLLLDWKQPSVSAQENEKGSQILFPESALGRKGAYELRQLMTDLNIPITIAGKTTESPGFFEGLKVSYTTSKSLRNVGLVICPAYVEHLPRLILRAISLSIPVIISSACGIRPSKQVHVFPAGDYMAMKNLVQQTLVNIS